MKDPIKEWLPQRLTPMWMLACAMRRPTGKISAQCADASCPPAAMENLLRQLDGGRVLLAQENPPPRWLTYGFEHAQLRHAVRPDGWQLAVLVRPETEAAQNLDAICDEFLALVIK